MSNMRDLDPNNTSRLLRAALREWPNMVAASPPSRSWCG